MNFMFVIFFIGGRGLLFFEFHFLLVKTFKFAMWPAGDTLLTTLFLQGGDADAEFDSSLSNRKMKKLGENLIG